MAEITYSHQAMRNERLSFGDDPEVAEAIANEVGVELKKLCNKKRWVLFSSEDLKIITIEHAHNEAQVDRIGDAVHEVIRSVLRFY